MSKMTDIKLAEVSAVDYPAHMVHGFAVMKSADPDKNKALLSALRKEEMPVDVEPGEVLKNLTAEEIIKALSAEQTAEFEKAFTKKPADKNDDDADEDDFKKSLPENVRKMFEDQEAEIAKRDERIAKAEEIAKEERETRLDNESVAKSEKTFDNLAFDHSKVAPAIRKFALVDAEAAEEITKMLTAVNAQDGVGDIFKELGTSADDVKKTAYEQLVEKANEIVKADSVSFNEAFAKATEQNTDLVTAYYKENA